MTLPYSTTSVDHTKHTSVKNSVWVGRLKANLAGEERAEIVNGTISFSLIKVSESKYLIDSFGFFFHRRLLSKEPENLISWHDHSAESVFSNLFPERGTSVFFALRHAMYLLREMRNENRQRLRSERVAF